MRRETNEEVIRRLSCNLAPVPVWWGDALTAERLWPCAELPAVLGTTLDAGGREWLIQLCRAAYRTGRSSGPGRPAEAAGRAARDALQHLPRRSEWRHVSYSLRNSIVRDKVGRSPKLCEALRYTARNRVKPAPDWCGPVFAEDQKFRVGCDWQSARETLRKSGPEALIEAAAKDRAETERTRRHYEWGALPPRTRDPVEIAALIGRGVLFARVLNGFCGMCDSEASGAWCVVRPDWTPSLRVPGQVVGEVRHWAQNVGDKLRISELEILLSALEGTQNANPGHPGPWTWPT